MGGCASLGLRAGIERAVSMNNDIESQVVFSKEALLGFAEVAEQLAPSAIYEIAREILESSVADESKEAVLAICLNIEQDNNGLLAFFKAVSA